MNITSKYRSLSVQAKAALWFTICSFLQKGISFITVPIFTRLMSTEEYGTYTVYLSWLQILTIMTSLYLFNGVYDNAMAKYEKQRDEYTSAMQGLTLVITGTVFALYCFTSGFWEKILNLPKSMILLMFLEALLSPALSYWSGRQRFEYRYRILVCVTILQALMNPIASLVLIRINGGTAMMRILGIVGVQICICVPIIVFQFCKGKEFFSKEYWGYALRIGIPIVPHYLSGIILNQGDRIMIDKMVGKTEVALYGLAYSIGMLVQLFISGMNSALTPWMYSKIKKGDIRSMRKVLQLLSIVVVGIAVALMLISPELVLIFGSPKYREAVYVIPPVAASVFFIFIYNILSMPQFYYEKTPVSDGSIHGGGGSECGAELYFYPPVRLYCGRLHDAGMLYAVFGRPLYCEQTDSGERRNPGKSDESRISCGVLRFSDWSKHHLQSYFPVQNPALRDSARKCRAGLLEERTSAEDDGGYPEKIKKWGRI